MAHNHIINPPTSGAELMAGQRSLLPLLYRSDQYEGWGEGMRAITRALLANLTLPDSASGNPSDIPIWARAAVNASIV